MPNVAKTATMAPKLKAVSIGMGSSSDGNNILAELPEMRLDPGQSLSTRARRRDVNLMALKYSRTEGSLRNGLFDQEAPAFVARAPTRRWV
jgi:hypothetical protein